MERFLDSFRAGGTGRGAYILTSQISSQIPLLVKGVAGQTANIFEVQNNTGLTLFSVSPTGNLTITGSATIILNEAVTGNISLNGNLSVTGTTSLTGAVTIASTLRVTGATTLGTLTADTITSTGTLTASTNLIVVGSAFFSNGTASVPSISFAADTDTGLYRIAANSLGVTVGGSNLLTANTSGLTVVNTVTITPATDVGALAITEFSSSPTGPIFNIKKSDGTSMWTFNKTQLNTISVEGITLSFDTANGSSSTTSRSGMGINLNAGYTGSGTTTALSFDSLVAGTDATYTADSTVYGYRPGGNRGIGGFSRATTTGHNTGVMGIAGGGNRNYGGWFTATKNKSTAVNIGVFATGLQLSGGAGAASIGGYFTLYNTATAPLSPVSCAILVDNGAFATPIAIFRDNATAVHSIEDGGDMIIGDRLATTNLGYRFFHNLSLQTTDATVTTIQTVAVPSNTAMQIQYTVTAINSLHTKGASFKKLTAFKNNAGTITRVGTVDTNIHVSSDFTTASVAYVISGTNVLVQVTGEAATTIRWQCCVETNSLTA